MSALVPSRRLRKCLEVRWPSQSSTASKTVGPSSSARQSRSSAPASLFTTPLVCSRQTILICSLWCSTKNFTKYPKSTQKAQTHLNRSEAMTTFSIPSSPDTQNPAAREALLASVSSSQRVISTMQTCTIPSTGSTKMKWSPLSRGVASPRLQTSNRNSKQKFVATGK